MVKIKKPLLKIQISGVMTYEMWQAKACARYITANFQEQIAGYNMSVFFQTQWDQHLKQLQIEKKGDFYKHKGNMIVYINDKYIGDCDMFL